MLKPYVYVACEKVIVAKDDVASLIGLFSKIIVDVPAGTDIPSNAVTPKEWAVFSIWDIEPGDEQKKYMLCTQILYPDQSQFGDIARSEIKVELYKRSQIAIQLNGIPIGQIGHYTVRTWIEENQQRVFGPIELKIEVEMTRKETPQKTT